jgi:opacity protein-like surface antigen
MKSIATLAALIMMATPSFAATKKASAKATKTTTSTPAPKATESTSTSSESSHSESKVKFNAGFGLGTAGSAFHFGVLGGGMISVANTEIGEITVGGQTGFLLHPGTVTQWIIPIMAAGQLTFKQTANMTPYAGLAMGVGIGHASISSTNPFTGTTSSVSNTATDFAMLVKGGVNFSGGKYYAELPLGTLGNAFCIFPSVGMNF